MLEISIHPTHGVQEISRVVRLGISPMANGDIRPGTGRLQMTQEFPPTPTDVAGVDLFPWIWLK